MNKLTSNQLQELKRFFFQELEPVLGKRETQIYFERSCESFLHLSKASLILEGNRNLSESEILKFLYAIKSYKKFEPLAHVLGEQYFFGMSFKVNPNVLIPRPETEELVDLIIKEQKAASKILDIGTGSGCIAVSIKKALPSSEVTAIDISEEALTVAAENAIMLNQKVVFHKVDALDLSSAVEIDKKWDVVVSNPPYIPVREKIQMEVMVTQYEPEKALFVPDNDPLLFYREIAIWTKSHLSENGMLYFEIHEDFSKETRELLEGLGYTNVRILEDLQGKSRMVSAKMIYNG